MKRLLLILTFALASFAPAADLPSLDLLRDKEVVETFASLPVQESGRIKPLENIASYCRSNGHLLNIEIKPTPGTERHTGEVVAQHAARLWADEAIKPLLTSFQIEALEGAKATPKAKKAAAKE